MTDSSDRITCPQCGSNNFPSSQECWNCKAVLSAQGNDTPPPGSPPPYQPGPPPGGIPVSPSPYPPTGQPANTQVFFILGIIFSILALIPCCGIIFGIAGLVMGIIAQAKGDRRGVWIIVASIVASIIGIILAFTAVGQAMLNDPTFRDMMRGAGSKGGGEFTPPAPSNNP